jgi:hypothetical protein
MSVREEEPHLRLEWPQGRNDFFTWFSSLSKQVLEWCLNVPACGSLHIVLNLSFTRHSTINTVNSDNGSVVK